MAHPTRIVTCSNPSDPHALHGLTPLPRTGELDVIYGHCAGHGQWNIEIDLVSQRAKRAGCTVCDGRGWIETGDDPVPAHDIRMTDAGHPEWVIRLDPPRR